MVNGSDYPLVNVKLLFFTRLFMNKGMITKIERSALNEIYLYNPLLFDFVLKRTLRGPERQSFPPSLFMKNKNLDLWSEWDKSFFNNIQIPKELSTSSENKSEPKEEEKEINIDEHLKRRKKLQSQISSLEELLNEKREELHNLQITLSNRFGSKFGVDSIEVDKSDFERSDYENESLEQIENIVLEVPSDDEKDEININ